MSEVQNPVEDSAVSTGPDTDAVYANTLPEGFDDFVDTMSELSAAANAPADNSTEDMDLDELLEVSEDEPSEDDSNIDDGEETETGESDEEDTPDSIVDWTEMREHQFNIDGKVYSANDLKAALGRQTKQEEARKEVEARSAAVEAREAKAVAAEEVLQGRLETFQKQSQLHAGSQQLEQLREQQAQVAARGDESAWNKLQMKIQPLERQLQHAEQQLQSEVQAVSAKNLEVQARILEERGYGSLLKDKQRIGVINDYVSENYSPTLLSKADVDAEVLILLDKAQKYDAAQKSGQKRKLKGTSSKNFKSGAGVTKSTQKKADPLYSMADQFLGLS